MYNDRISEFESVKTYGIIGMILELIGTPADIFLHGFGFIISIIGLIFILIALKKISNYYHNKKPYRYMIYSVISGIAMGIVGALAFISLISGILINPGGTVTTSSGTISESFIFEIIAFLGIMVLGLIISIIFQYMAYKSVYDLTGIEHFNTGALLLLIGAILTIIVIGAFIMFAGFILIILGFNELPDHARKNEPPTEEQIIA